MQVRIEDVSPVEKKLVVEVPWETVSNKLGAAYRELAKGVQLKGFRKGKVPRSVLQRMFGKRVRAEVADQLVRESFITAATEHELQAVSEPVVQDAPEIKKGEPFAFEAIVEVRGDVEAKDYDGMELTKRPLRVADEAVDAALEQLRQEHTELMPIEGRDVTARTDVVTIKIKGTVGEHVIDRDRLAVDLGEPERDPIPGLIAALIGLPINVEDHTIELDIPEDFRDAEIAGKKAELTVSITDARLKEVPELDDEFAADTGKGETVDELRAATRKELEEREQEQIDREVRDAALKELVNRNQIPVAPALIDRAIDYQYQRLKMMLGIHDHDHDHGHDHGPDAELREKMEPQALDEVRGQLLLDAVATKEGIEVTDEDIASQVANMAKMRGVAPARLRAELDRDGRLDSLRFQITQDKTLDLLVSRATVTEVEPPPPEEEEEAAEAGSEAEAGDDAPAEGAEK